MDCDGCKHLQYEAETNSTYCKLNKELTPHPDEPETLYCSDKGED